jgi:hypothetical protein
VLGMTDPAWGADSRSSGPSKSLSAAAADPTEPLLQLTTDHDVAVSNRKGEGAAYQFLIQPVIPLQSSKVFPVAQIIRPTIPIGTSPGPNRKSGLGDVALFDIFLPDRFSWGSFGLGPTFVFPTATSDRLGSGKWQVGPAAALIYEAIAHIQLGVIIQNPISFAGDGDRHSVNEMTLQPIAQYNFPKGWYVSIGDLNWTLDWESGGDLTLPVALQVGRVMPIFGPQWNLGIEPFYVASHHGPSPRWGFRFGISLLVPER